MKTKDYPLGSTFEYEGVTLSVVVDRKLLGCNDCWLGDKTDPKCPICNGERRADGHEVIFVKVPVMTDYRIKVRYTFEGQYYVSAESEERAREIALNDCGLVMGGGIHTSNPGRVVGWKFDSHPEKQVITIKQINSLSNP